MALALALALTLALTALPAVGEAEALEEFFKRIGLSSYRHPLTGRDVHDRRLKLGREVRKGLRRSSRGHCRGRVLRHLSSGGPSR